MWLEYIFFNEKNLISYDFFIMVMLMFLIISMITCLISKAVQVFSFKFKTSDIEGIYFF